MNSLEVKHSVKALIADTKRKFKIRNLTQLDIDDMINWAWEGMRLIGSAPTYKEFVDVDLTINQDGLYAEIPCNAIHLRALRINGANLEITHDLPRDITKSIELRNSGITFWLEYPLIKFNPFPTFLDSEGNKLVIDSAKLDYQGFELDEEFNPLIKDSHFVALPYYLGYLYWLGRPDAPIDPDSLYQKWLFYCPQARGNDSMPNMAQRRYIGKLWNNMMHYTQEQVFGVPTEKFGNIL